MIYTFIELMRCLETALEIRVMSYDMEILSLFFDYSHLHAGEILTASSASAGALFTCLKRMENQGVLASTADTTDRRKRIYHLSEETRTTLVDSWKNPSSAGSKIRQDIADDPVAALHDLNNVCEQRLNIRHMSPEANILLHLYNEGGLTNSALKRRVNGSISRINNALKAVRDLGHVQVLVSPDDARRRPYFLSNPTKKVLDKSVLHVGDWMKSKARYAT